RKTLRPVLAAAGDVASAVKSAGTWANAAPCSSQGFAVSPWRESHHRPMAMRPLRKTRMLPMSRSRRRLRARLVLRQEVLGRARNAVIIGPTIDDRHVLAPIAVRGRRFRRLPFQRGGPPGVASRRLSGAKAPEEVEHEENLDRAHD